MLRGSYSRCKAFFKGFLHERRCVCDYQLEWSRVGSSVTTHVLGSTSLAQAREILRQVHVNVVLVRQYVFHAGRAMNAQGSRNILFFVRARWPFHTQGTCHTVHIPLF